MEIERKFIMSPIPDLSTYPKRVIEQGYLSRNPVVRVRKDNDNYYLTYKAKGFMAREEYNLPLNKEAYEHLIKKADGNIISKVRYLIPEKNGLTIELDIFEKDFEGLTLAEVEFESKEDALNYEVPEFFVKDVTECKEYHNSQMSTMDKSSIKALIEANQALSHFSFKKEGEAK